MKTERTQPKTKSELEKERDVLIFSATEDHRAAASVNKELAIIYSRNANVSLDLLKE